MTAHDVRPIYKIEGTMNENMYQKVLEKHLLEAAENIRYPVNEIIF